MNKKIAVILLPFVILSCRLFPLYVDPPLDQDNVPTKVTETGQEQIESLETDGFVIVRLHPNSGDLQPMLADEAQKALSLGLMPVVEFDATWCPPCRAIDKAITSKNKLLMDAYRGAYIIKLDVDEWGWKNGKVKNFRFEGIPVYFKLDDKGKQTGEVIDGGAWGEDIPENIAPVMDEFFHDGQ